MKKADYLFVYGSLQQSVEGPQHKIMEQYFSFVNAAKVRGLLYDVGEYPAGIAAATGHFIKGELYKLKDPALFDDAFSLLDEYEETYGQTGLYSRSLVPTIAGDKEVMAWIYWYNKTVDGLPLISSGDALQYYRSKK